MAQLDRLILNTYRSSMALVDWESCRSHSVSKGESLEGDRKKQLERVEIQVNGDFSHPWEWFQNLIPLASPIYLEAATVKMQENILTLALPDTKAERHQGNRGNCSINSPALSSFKYLNADFGLLKIEYENSEGRTMTTKRILVVDDEACVQEVVQACFEEIAGWEVMTASSGQEGLEKAAKEQPDAIILDVMMPGMDGIGFLQRLKTDPSIKSIPVVLLTAKIDFTEPSRLVMLGIAGAIAKPFDPILLVEQVAESLGWIF